MMSPMVSIIKKPVEFPIEVRIANTRHIPDDIPIPSKEKGFLLILLMIISATIYPAI